MKRLCFVSLVAAALIVAHLHLAAAETGKFRHLVSVYVDDKGAGLNLPEGVACGANGQVVVGDTGNDRLLRFTFREKTVGAGSEIKIPEVLAPSKVQLDSKGEIYALDSKQRRIVHLDSEGKFKDALTFQGVPPPATIVPKDFAIDSADNIYVLDVFSARVVVLDARGQFQKALPFPADIGFGSALAVDPTGTLVLLDAVKRKMFSAEQAAGAFSPMGGDLTQFLATLPTSLTATKTAIYVVEGTGGSVAGFGRDGSFLTRQLAAGWIEGALNHPSQMCINDKDEVFIADRDNSRIQVFQLIR